MLRSGTAGRQIWYATACEELIAKLGLGERSIEAVIVIGDVEECFAP
jgi:hypothetical protein